MSQGRTPNHHTERVGPSIQEFQQSLRSGRVLNDPNPEYLSELQDRLARVQCLGGTFEAIGFSPDLELLLKKSVLPNKTKMATV